MRPFAMEMAAILVHGPYRLFIVATVAVAKLLLCCDIICKCSILTGGTIESVLGGGWMARKNIYSHLHTLFREVHKNCIEITHSSQRKLSCRNCVQSMHQQ